MDKRTSKEEDRAIQALLDSSTPEGTLLDTLHARYGWKPQRMQEWVATGIPKAKLQEIAENFPEALQHPRELYAYKSLTLAEDVGPDTMLTIPDMRVLRRKGSQLYTTRLDGRVVTLWAWDTACGHCGDLFSILLSDTVRHTNHSLTSKYCIKCRGKGYRSIPRAEVWMDLA